MPTNEERLVLMFWSLVWRTEKVHTNDMHRKLIKERKTTLNYFKVAGWKRLVLRASEGLLLSK